MPKFGDIKDVLSAIDQFDLTHTSFVPSKDDNVKVEYNQLEDKFLIRLGTTHEVDTQTLVMLIKLAANSLKAQRDFKSMGS